MDKFIDILYYTLIGMGAVVFVIMVSVLVILFVPIGM